MFACCATDEGSKTAEDITLEKEQKATTPEPAIVEQMEEAAPAAVAAPKAEAAKKFEGPGKVSVSLKREKIEQPWGLVVELVFGSSDMLLITEVSSGSSGEVYNKSAAAGAYLLEPRDVITKINGKSDTAAMLKQLRLPMFTMDFDVNRLRATKHTIKKEGRPLGVTLKHSDPGTTLYVKEIKDTSMLKQSGHDIKPGDLIMAVNGKSGRAVELFELMKSNDVLEVEAYRLEGR